MSGRAIGTGNRRRIALLLLAFALLFRLPAGLMPEAGAQGFSIGWCNAVDNAAIAEGKALFEQALAGKPDPTQKHAPDQPCPFAAAAQPMVSADPAPMPLPVSIRADAPSPAFVAAPGRGLAAPPPRSTGPPRLA